MLILTKNLVIAVWQTVKGHLASKGAVFIEFPYYNCYCWNQTIVGSTQLISAT